MEFKFTEQEINLILRALGELPAKTSMQLISNIATQAKNQTVVNTSKEEDEEISEQ